MIPKFAGIIVTIFLALNAYTQSWDWVRKAGGLKSDKASTVVVDQDGNVYFTGYYNEQADFGPFNTGFSFSSSKEVFLAKMDPNGNFLWVTNALNYYDDRGLGLCVDPSGNAYVTGTCWGGLDWGGLSVYAPSSYTDQIFVTKIDPNGSIVWMKNAGNYDGTVNVGVNENGSPQTLYQDDHGQDLACDSQGNIFVTGFLSNIDDVNYHDAYFDAITISLPPMDSIAFLAKLSSSGNWEWVKTFGGEYKQRDHAICVDDEDNVYVCGGFYGTQPFGSTTVTSTASATGVTSEDIYVAKYDNDGNFQFVVTVGDTLDDRADGIRFSPVDGHLYVTGEFRGEVYFGMDDLNNYGSGQDDKDAFVAKLTKGGVWAWATKAGSKKGGDRGTSVCIAQSGNVIVSGQFRSEAKFGDIILNAGTDSTQAFVGAINATGEWVWVYQAGGPIADRATYVACDGCDAYAVGYFDQTLTVGDTTLTAYGGKDMFIAKLVDVCNGSVPAEPNTPENTGVFEEANVFTPNSDGKNDLLYFCENCAASGTIIIVNRWGEVVFQTDDVSSAWNGTNSFGQPVNDGTYFYKVYLDYPDGEKETKSGFITVIR